MSNVNVENDVNVNVNEATNEVLTVVFTPEESSVVNAYVRMIKENYPEMKDEAVGNILATTVAVSGLALIRKTQERKIEKAVEAALLKISATGEVGELCPDCGAPMALHDAIREAEGGGTTQENVPDTSTDEDNPFV